VDRSRMQRHVKPLLGKRRSLRSKRMTWKKESWRSYDQIGADHIAG
jgi:hypothetical protein